MVEVQVHLQPPWALGGWEHEIEIEKHLSIYNASVFWYSLDNNNLLWMKTKYAFRDLALLLSADLCMLKGLHYFLCYKHVYKYSQFSLRTYSSFKLHLD